VHGPSTAFVIGVSDFGDIGGAHAEWGRKGSCWSRESARSQTEVEYVL